MKALCVGTYCKLTQDIEALVQQYTDASPEVKRKLESRYGKKTLERTIKEWTYEKETINYLKANTTKCPTCTGKCA